MEVSAHTKDFGFPLEGAHRATPCGKCHEPEMKQAAGVQPKRSSLVLGGTTFAELKFEAKLECSDCHKTVHGDQFDVRKDKGRCDVCHSVATFAPAEKFNHDKDASFSLKGAHEKVPCNQCHPTDPNSGDPKRVIYRPVSGKCESCHGKEIPK